MNQAHQMDTFPRNHHTERLDLDVNVDGSPIVWIDCEMSGLNLSKDHIIEIACVITDSDLNVITKMNQPIVVHHTKEFMDDMGDWCKHHHGTSGLTDLVIASTTTMTEAQEQLLTFIKRSVPMVGSAMLAGNSVHIDREFLLLDMPLIVDHLSYRIIDVSTITTLVKRWCSKAYCNRPVKHSRHRALDDILESIEELAYYKNFVFCSSV